MSVTSWFLVSSGGTRHRLPREMIFVGRDDCELMLQSRSVDKQHAVINYDSGADEHKVKDLGSLNGVNQCFVDIDILSFFCLTLSDIGFPGDKDHRKIEDQGGKEDGLYSLCREPSYFEIPTKEAQQTVQMTESKIHEIPTKDTEGPHGAAAGHASFTIEFDDSSPGKVTIKDHVTKFNPDHRARPKKSPQSGKELTTLQAAMIAAENKVADWLAQNDPPIARRESTEEDSKSIKSDVPVHLKRLKGSKHEDGTQSDSENGAGHRLTSKRAILEERAKAHHGHKGHVVSAPGIQGVESHVLNRTAFMIDFFDEDNPRKRRSYSFTQTAAGAMAAIPGEGPSPIPPTKMKGGVPVDCKGTPSPLAASQSSKHILKQKSEDSSLLRSSASVGQQTSPNEQLAKPLKPIGVFGVEEPSKSVRPVVPEHQKETVKDWPSSVVQELRKTQFVSSGLAEAEILSEGPIAVGSPRWVSQWASLAATHTGPEAEDTRSNPPAVAIHEKDADISESGISVKSTASATSTSSHGERMRRTLPQLPTNEGQRSKPVKVLRSEIGEKQDTEPQEKETSSRFHQKGSEADKAVRSVHKSISGSQALTTDKEKSECVKGTAKQAFSIMQQQEQNINATAWASKSNSGVKLSRSTEKIRESTQRLGSSSIKTDIQQKTEDKKRRADSPRSLASKLSDGERKESKPLVRQGSFTIEKPSVNVPIELIPRINKQTGSSQTQERERSDSVGTDSSIDTTLLLKDTEAVMAFLEAKLREENKLDAGEDTPSYHLEDSISPESDVDTASTISLVAGDGERKAIQKRRTLSSLHKEKSSPSRDQSKASTSARERLEKKTKCRASESRAETRKTGQMNVRARQPSLDLTDDDQTSSLPHSMISDILSSDQENYSSRSQGRGQFTSTDDLLHSKIEASKTSKTKTPPAPIGGTGKPATLPRPRPTRASLLRRARLGETSDNDLADADKVSVASEVSTTSSTSKPPSGRKTPSRIDMLAQPRRTRIGSFSARSDSEATVTRSSTSSRILESSVRSGVRPTSTIDSKIVPRMRANSVSKLPDSKSKISATHVSPSVNARWRRMPPDYASTSEDEFGSNLNSPKHARLRVGTALRTARVPNVPSLSLGGVVLKHKMKEQEDYIRDWTAHSEEIARISQDLAKDLAILAREIHDVAGEIDSVSSSGTAPSTTVSTAATTPGSAIDTREELVDRVFDESLNFRKIPPVVHNKAPEINGRPVELRHRNPDASDTQAAIRRRTWNRDEVSIVNK
ncbi:CE170 protein, partial [Polypterus senegalus]